MKTCDGSGSNFIIVRPVRLSLMPTVVMHFSKLRLVLCIMVAGCLLVANRAIADGSDTSHRSYKTYTSHKTFHKKHHHPKKKKPLQSEVKLHMPPPGHD